ncbi:MAG: hypothetical protein J07HQX50_02389 [Haloquadratum sp. J07HQX50]|nr:MAG: hypothetical protein J07HQX50_02389 [Haloquadratum sp. J07HQX50]
MKPHSAHRVDVCAEPTCFIEILSASDLYSTCSYSVRNAHLWPHNAPVRSRMLVKSSKAITSHSNRSASFTIAFDAQWSTSRMYRSSRPLDCSSVRWALRVPVCWSPARALSNSRRLWVNSRPLTKEAVLVTARFSIPRSTRGPFRPRRCSVRHRSCVGGDRCARSIRHHGR